MRKLIKFVSFKVPKKISIEDKVLKITNKNYYYSIGKLYNIL